MGNDGGSIPDRRDLVKSKPKAEQADKANQTRARWFFCALSKRPLQEPIVSCALGKLYNKDALLEYLLDRSSYGDGEKICSHIRSLKDIKTLKLSPNVAPAPPKDSQTHRAPFICPLTLKEMNGSQPFTYLWTCGCVFSQAGLTTMLGPASLSSTPPKDSESDPKQLDICPQCTQKFNRNEDIFTINPSPEEEEKMIEAMERRRLLEPAKKTKKRKAGVENAGAEPPTKKSAFLAPSTNPNIAAASRAIVSGLAMEEAKRKASMSDALKSVYGSNAPKRKDTFMTMGTFTRYA